MSLGNNPLAALIACCTSCAAASILRDRSNCSVIEVTPTPLNDVIWLSDGIEVNCCSSGVATADAIVLGLAPGYCALLLIVGKSTLGTAATGSRLYAPMPNTRTPSINSEVPIGRRMNGSEMLIDSFPFSCSGRKLRSPRPRASLCADRHHQAPQKAEPGCHLLPLAERGCP